MITGVCPTYGRFQLLRDAVACFLLQDYKPRHLIILNDAPEPLKLIDTETVLRVPGCTISVWNADERFPTLGHKRQALLEAANSDYVAHWDDDDWYLPWHLWQCVAHLEDSEALCVKPRGAWWCIGGRDNLTAVKGPRHNVFEGQMAFNRRAALHLGGYSKKDSGQAKDLLYQFKHDDSFKRFEPDVVSYCYRWGHRGAHVSACSDGNSWADKNQNFGDGEPLIPANHNPMEWAADTMRSPFQRLVDSLPARQDETKKALREHRKKHGHRRKQRV